MRLVTAEDQLADDTRRAQEIRAKFSPKFARTKVRYTPPKARPHGEFGGGPHEPEGADLDENLRPYGMRRDKRGRIHPPPMHRGPRPEGTIPARTRENVAACAALGLSYWSDHPATCCLWAVDANQVAHIVKIDRKAGKAAHRCWAHECGTTWTRENPCPETGRIETWTAAATDEQFAFQLDPVTDRIDRMVERAKKAREAEPEDYTVVAVSEEGNPVVIAEVTHTSIAAETHEEWMARMRAKGGLNQPDPETAEERVFEPDKPIDDTMCGELWPDDPTRRCTRDRAHQSMSYPSPGLHWVAGTDGTVMTSWRARKTKAAQPRSRTPTKSARAAREAKPKAARNSGPQRSQVQQLTDKTMAKADKSQSAYAEAGLHNEKPMSREAALALLRHDPDYLGDITTAALIDLAECDEAATYHQRIRDELRDNRGLTPVDGALTPEQRWAQSGVR